MFPIYMLIVRPAALISPLLDKRTKYTSLVSITSAICHLSIKVDRIKSSIEIWGKNPDDVFIVSLVSSIERVVWGKRSTSHNQHLLLDDDELRMT